MSKGSYRRPRRISRYEEELRHHYAFCNQEMIYTDSNATCPECKTATNPVCWEHLKHKPESWAHRCPKCAEAAVARKLASNASREADANVQPWPNDFPEDWHWPLHTHPFHREWECPHGIGHGIIPHSCDGCCSHPSFPLNGAGDIK